jgi:hypothetical protein
MTARASVRTINAEHELKKTTTNIAMSQALAPALILLGWALYFYTDHRWGSVPPKQLPDPVVWRLALADMGTRSLVYLAAFFLFTSKWDPDQRSQHVLMVAGTLMLLGTEGCARWWVAAASMGTDLYYRIPRVLGLSPLGYGLVPLWGFAAGCFLAVLTTLVRRTGSA